MAKELTKHLGLEEFGDAEMIMKRRTDNHFICNCCVAVCTNMIVNNNNSKKKKKERKKYVLLCA